MRNSAIKWATERVGSSGVIGFVTNGSFLDAAANDGLRKCLAEEFSSIYVFHLRGNQRTSGEQSKREGGKIFGSGSRAPIAISILVKNPKAEDHGRILFRDIGDYLTREEKLEIIDTYTSIKGITEADGWTSITPDEHGDWLAQRDDSFSQHILIGSKEKGISTKIFHEYSDGIITNRDEWVYDYSDIKLRAKLSRMFSFHSDEIDRLPLGPIVDAAKLVRNEP